MQLSLTQDILSVTEFKKSMKDTLDQVHKTHRPIVLTVNGRADAVVVDAQDYERQQAELELARNIMQAEKEYAAGKARPARTFLKELKRAYKL
jgi:prevent-host-death family protein